jgi:predicted dienelactone hydrolase
MTSLVSVLSTVLLAPALTAGFQSLTVPDGNTPPLTVGVWYPSDSPATPHALGSFQQAVALDGRVAGGRAPLILISHGTAGSLASHYDTALALADAGFIVAAVTHAGDNFQDQRYAGQLIDLTDRPRQIIRVIDFMLNDSPIRDHIDRARIGMLGSSLGGFTALVVAGAEPDVGRLRVLCSTRPRAPECLFIKSRHGNQLDRQSKPPVWAHDGRVRAAVIAAPAVGVVFDRNRLRNVTIPIQLWEAGNDRVSPNEWNGDVIRGGLPTQPEARSVAGADHYVFLAPCSQTLVQQAPQICRDAPGVNRSRFHAEFNGAVVAFFERALGRDRSAVEDICQDVLCLAIAKIRAGAVREPERLSGFVAAIARTKVIEHFRGLDARGAREALVRESPPVSAPDPDLPGRRRERTGAARAAKTI